ncbi:hypothetical protein KRR26_35700 [Corallococcus sp. M34]|uniref:hypothetical protein n=1 Tax=Citreicoccus inhibens TaxID=2849499 RepID=UPI001C218836|nr:hypothetical protein [Citreicoccus inhibens]MBU8900955.1 hypothetical protein [Citreicoccus inhibens]
MNVVIGPEADSVVNVMRQYLRSGTTGCLFAAAYAAAKDAIQWGVWSGTSPSESLHAGLSGFFTSAAQILRPGIAVFPEIRTADDLVGLLVGLAGKTGWSLSRDSWRKYARDDELVSLWWRTPAGLRTSVMGFAPLGSMPVTRRAPFLAIAAWAGPKLNPQKSTKMKTPDPSDEVGFVDLRPLQPEAYEKMWDATRQRVKELTALPQEGAARPSVAFCLPAACAPLLAPYYLVPSV